MAQLRCIATWSLPAGDQSFCALITTYYATHGSVQIVCSSSSGFTIASLSVDLPSKTWHSRRSGLWPFGWNAEAFFCSPHLLSLSLCPCVFTPVQIWGGIGKICESWFQAQRKTQSLIYFWRGAAAQVSIHFPDKFWGGGRGRGRPMNPYFSEMGDRTVPNCGTRCTMQPSSVFPKFVLCVRHVASFWNCPKVQN